VQPGRAAVAIVGVLGQQAQDDKRKLGRYLGSALRRGERLPCDVRVDQLQRVVPGERWLADEHLVERRPQAVEVGAVVHGTAHAPGLFGGDVGQGPRHPVGVGNRLWLLRQRGGDVEIDQLDPPVRRDHDVGGFDVLVDDPRRVDGHERAGHALGDSEGLPEGQRPVDEAQVQARASDVEQRQRRPAAVPLDPPRPHHPRALDAAEQLELAPQQRPHREDVPLLPNLLPDGWFLPLLRNEPPHARRGSVVDEHRPGGGARRLRGKGSPRPLDWLRHPLPPRLILAESRRAVLLFSARSLPPSGPGIRCAR
jgi:hypothetical protein